MLWFITITIPLQTMQLLCLFPPPQLSWAAGCGSERGGKQKGRRNRPQCWRASFYIQSHKSQMNPQDCPGILLHSPTNSIYLSLSSTTTSNSLLPLKPPIPSFSTFSASILVSYFIEKRNANFPACRHHLYRLPSLLSYTVYSHKQWQPL